MVLRTVNRAARNKRIGFRFSGCGDVVDAGDLHTTVDFKHRVATRFGMLRVDWPPHAIDESSL